MMPVCRIHVLLVLILLDVAYIPQLRWVLGSPLAVDPNRICRRGRRIGGQPLELCQSWPLVREVAQGTRMGMRECQHQLQHQRWNCSTHSRSLAKVLQQDIRETAFVYAITAAGVVHAVTQACSQGELLACGCVRELRVPEGRGPWAGGEGPRWEWGGCGDDVDFGYEKSRQFTDSRRRRGKSDIRTLVDLHNNEAGRLAVRSFMRMECKCHGLSGSCTLRSCWRKMPLFRDVGNRLVLTYHNAVHVMGSNDGKSLIPLRQGAPPPDAHNLVYSTESPDFCTANWRAGSEGTRGRVCDSVEAGPSDCQSLCCGRGHIDSVLEQEESCMCHFRWCCVVTCQRCTVRRSIRQCQ